MAMNTPLIFFAVCFVVVLIVFGIYRWRRRTRIKAAKEQKLRECREKKLARQEAILEREARLIALTPGSTIEYDGHTYTVGSVTIFSSSSTMDQYRFILNDLNDGTTALRWLYIQTHKFGYHDLEIVELQAWAVDPPDFDTCEIVEYDGKLFRITGVFTIPYQRPNDNPLYYDGVVQDVCCRPEASYDWSALRIIDPTLLRFEKFDDGEWTLGLATEVSALDIEVLT